MRDGLTEGSGELGRGRVGDGSSRGVVRCEKAGG